MDRNKLKNNKRQKRRKRIRARVAGDSKRPRFSVFRSLRGIYAQLIDDISGKTLVSANSQEKEIEKEKKKGDGKVGVAYAVGELMAKRAKEKGIDEVVFDRGGYQYHGRVKALAEGARKGGLKF